MILFLIIPLLFCAWVFVGYISGCLMERVSGYSDKDLVFMSSVVGPLAVLLLLLFIFFEIVDKLTQGRPSKLRRWIRGF